VISLDISDILPDFPDYRVALVVAVDLRIAAERPPELAARIDIVEAEAAAALGETPLAEIPEINPWRAAYKAMGVKKTSYRSSVERLLKQIQQGRGLPRVNGLVDAYNAVSARHRLPVGADDLDKVAGGLAFRHAREGDAFFALGATPAADDPPKPGEVVYADGAKILCRRWNWYQDARSATSLDTRRAALTVQSLGGVALEPAAEALCQWLGASCGGRTAWAVAEASNPRAEVILGGAEDS
jgi:DNA/RNA-binding domain of Phe-tRNA-synthetase-like protein